MASESARQDLTPEAAAALKREITRLGNALGFQQVGIASVDLSTAGEQLRAWLADGWHGSMDYMARHGSKRWTPSELVPGTLSVISARMDYWPPDSADPITVLGRPDLAYVSRYALGRDYHKLLRRRLQTLADQLAERIGAFGHRVFVDSAPVLEKPLAHQAGLGWIGKHTNLISRAAGSYFFLGEIYTDLPLPADTPARDHCGSCSRCLRACPTGALPAPYRIDARRCISYLTIEHDGPIDIELRPAIGNRIYGCDDCQLVCPWNRYARLAGEPDFRVRHGLDASSLLQLFAWTEDEFLQRTEGSAIRRIGHRRWRRNLAVALGNAEPDPIILATLRAHAQDPDPVVAEHVQWAIEQQLRDTPRTRFPSALDQAVVKVAGHVARRAM